MSKENERKRLQNLYEGWLASTRHEIKQVPNKMNILKLVSNMLAVMKYTFFSTVIIKI